MVMEYLDGGDFRSKLETTFKNYEWREKIRMLWFLASGLDSIHSVGYTHRDLHGGNILFRSGTTDFPCISDFGLSNNDRLNSKLHGILSYIAPEILDKEPFSPAADIYSFGIIMTELATGKLAFHDRPHDNDLAIEICKGLRPDIGKGTPQFYINLAEECLSGDPLRRPTASTLVKFLDFCDRAFSEGNYMVYTPEKVFLSEHIKKTFEDADKVSVELSEPTEIHPKAVYLNRRLEYKGLPKSRNSKPFFNLMGRLFELLTIFLKFAYLDYYFSMMTHFINLKFLSH